MIWRGEKWKEQSGQIGSRQYLIAQVYAEFLTHETLTFQHSPHGFGRQILYSAPQGCVGQNYAVFYVRAQRFELRRPRREVALQHHAGAQNCFVAL